MELFKLLGTIAIDNSDANKALDDTSQKGEKTQSKLSKAFSSVGKGAAVVGKAVATGLAVGGAAMGTLTIKALNMSGELEQNMGGSEAVFGKHADKMQSKAKEAFSNMGLSTSDYLATANKMGALFQGAGFDIEESMNLSSDAMQRAADVASIMGIDTSSAMEAIAGAAKGNFTMMDNLGVAMNDTTLNAYALEKGIGKTTQEMTNQEKIGLAMEMFMEKTAYAAGNYRKENETLAGSLGTAKAALTNFLDGSGDVESLVTAFSNAANVIVDNLKTLAPRLISGITDIINQIIPMLPPLLNQLLPVIIEGAVSLINGLVNAMPAVISALMDALPALIDGITQIVNALIEALPQILEMLIAALPALIPQLVDGLVSMIVTLCTMLDQIILPLVDAMPMIITAIVDALMANLPALLEAGGNLLFGLLEGMFAAIAKIPYVLGQIFEAIWGGICALFGIHSPSTVMMEIGRNIMEGLFNGVKALLGKISEIWNTVKEITLNVWNGIKSRVASIVDGVKTKVSNVFNGIKSVATNIWNNVKDAMTKPIEKARDTIKGIIDKIKGFFSGMKLEFPKIKMPHFSISGKFSLNPPSVPKLGIEWYKKAYNNPMLLNSPTIFGYDAASGNYLGGGDGNGSEVVAGSNTLMGMIQTAVAAQNEAMIYYLQKLIDILATYFPQVLESMERDFVWDDGVVAARLAPKMNYELGKLSTRKDRGR